MIGEVLLVVIRDVNCDGSQGKARITRLELPLDKDFMLPFKTFAFSLFVGGKSNWTLKVLSVSLLQLSLI